MPPATLSLLSIPCLLGWGWIKIPLQFWYNMLQLSFNQHLFEVFRCYFDIPSASLATQHSGDKINKALLLWSTSIVSFRCLVFIFMMHYWLCEKPDIDRSVLSFHSVCCLPPCEYVMIQIFLLQIFLTFLPRKGICAGQCFYHQLVT